MKFIVMVFPYKSSIEIEDIHFAGNLPIVADRGADSDIKHPVEDFLFNDYFYGIHAYGG